MSSNLHLVLDGTTLKPHALWQAARTALDPKSRLKINIAPEAREKISRAEAFVQKIVDAGQAVYGINTGFGKFAEVAISREQLGTLQENLILSHACGVGPKLGRDLVMSMWIIRLNTMARGNSGVRLQTVETICKMLESGILADIPSRGSVGASGDLAPSAHATLTLIGRGTCTYPRQNAFVESSSGDALRECGIPPVRLAAKEGLALINGTQTTTSLALKAAYQGQVYLQTANLAAALSIEALRGSHVIANPQIAAVRNQPGAIACAKQIAEWLGGETEISRSHAECGRVQDPYSLRCAPQVHGAIHDALESAFAVIENEINASTDNPLLFPEEEKSLSGGNFHALYTARVSDGLCSALTTLASISERRLALMMSKESSGLPPFLIQDGGLNSGFMMAQVTAAALVSESKTLSFPATVDSIPTSDDREDHVSMGVGAGLKLQQVVENLKHVLAIEILAAAQGIDLLRPLKTSPQLEKTQQLIRAKVAKLENDRVLATDMALVADLVENAALLSI